VEGSPTFVALWKVRSSAIKYEQGQRYSVQPMHVVLVIAERRHQDQLPSMLDGMLLNVEFAGPSQMLSVPAKNCP
jgi:hypothetical protein